MFHISICNLKVFRKNKNDTHETIIVDIKDEYNVNVDSIAQITWSWIWWKMLEFRVFLYFYCRLWSVWDPVEISSENLKSRRHNHFSIWSMWNSWENRFHFVILKINRKFSIVHCFAWQCKILLMKYFHSKGLFTLLATVLFEGKNVKRQHKMCQLEWWRDSFTRTFIVWKVQVACGVFSNQWHWHCK